MDRREVPVVPDRHEEIEIDLHRGGEGRVDDVAEARSRELAEGDAPVVGARIEEIDLEDSLQEAALPVPRRVREVPRTEREEAQRARRLQPRDGGQQVDGDLVVELVLGVATREIRSEVDAVVAAHTEAHEEVEAQLELHAAVDVETEGVDAQVEVERLRQPDALAQVERELGPVGTRHDADVALVHVAVAIAVLEPVESPGTEGVEEDLPHVVGEGRPAALSPEEVELAAHGVAQVPEERGSVGELVADERQLDAEDLSVHGIDQEIEDAVPAREDGVQVVAEVPERVGDGGGEVRHRERRRRSRVREVGHRQAEVRVELVVLGREVDRQVHLEARVEVDVEGVGTELVEGVPRPGPGIGEADA